MKRANTNKIQDLRQRGFFVSFVIGSDLTSCTVTNSEGKIYGFATTRNLFLEPLFEQAYEQYLKKESQVKKKVALATQEKLPLE